MWCLLLSQVSRENMVAQAKNHVQNVEVDIGSYKYDPIPQHYRIQNLEKYLSEEIVTFGKDDPTVSLAPVDGLEFEFDAEDSWITLGFFETPLGKTTWPTNGGITSGYGTRKHPISGEKHFHTGIDIGGTESSPIYAVADGKVESVGSDPDYGNTVVIDHGVYETMYAHLSQIDVEAGDRVSAGDVIGKMGSTGVSTGPHLHFEIRIEGEHINPLKILSR